MCTGALFVCPDAFLLRAFSMAANVRDTATVNKFSQETDYSLHRPRHQPECEYENVCHRLRAVTIHFFASPFSNLTIDN